MNITELTQSIKKLKELKTNFLLTLNYEKNGYDLYRYDYNIYKINLTSYMIYENQKNINNIVYNTFDYTKIYNQENIKNDLMNSDFITEISKNQKAFNFFEGILFKNCSKIAPISWNKQNIYLMYIAEINTFYIMTNFDTPEKCIYIVSEMKLNITNLFKLL